MNAEFRPESDFLNTDLGFKQYNGKPPNNIARQEGGEPPPVPDPDWEWPGPGNG